MSEKATTIRLDEWELAMLDLIAAREKRTRSDIVRVALRDYIQKNS